jgi:hypothetical protein
MDLRKGYRNIYVTSEVAFVGRCCWCDRKPIQQTNWHRHVGARHNHNNNNHTPACPSSDKAPTMYWPFNCRRDLEQSRCLWTFWLPVCSPIRQTALTRQSPRHVLGLRQGLFQNLRSTWEHVVWHETNCNVEGEDENEMSRITGSCSKYAKI